MRKCIKTIRFQIKVREKCYYVISGITQKSQETTQRKKSKTTKLIAIYHKRIKTKTKNLNVIYVEKFIGKNIISKDIWSFSIKLMTCVKLKRVSKKQWMQILVSKLVKKSSSITSRFLQKDSEQQTSKLRKGAEHKICSPLETSQ